MTEKTLLAILCWQKANHCELLGLATECLEWEQQYWVLIGGAVFDA